MAGVFGFEIGGVSGFLDEGFEGGFVVDEGGDDIAGSGGLAVFEHDEIALDDVAADHGVATHFEGEGAGGGAQAEQFEVDGHTAAGFLAAVFGAAGGDGAVDGEAGDGTAKGLGPGGNFGRVEDDAQGAGAAGLAGEGAFAAEGGDMVGGGLDAAEAEVAGDFAEGGGEGGTLDGVAHEVEDRALAWGEGFHSMTVQMNSILAGPV